MNDEVARILEGLAEQKKSNSENIDEGLFKKEYFVKYHIGTANKGKVPKKVGHRSK